MKHLIAPDIPADEVRIVGVALDPSGRRALVAAIYNPVDAGYEAIVTLCRNDASWEPMSENFGFGAGLAIFPEIHGNANFVEVPYLVASVPETRAETAIVSYCGQETRTTITDRFVVAALWHQSGPVPLRPAFEPDGGPFNATLEFIPEHDLRPGPEFPRIERYE